MFSLLSHLYILFCYETAKNLVRGYTQPCLVPLVIGDRGKVQGGEFREDRENGRPVPGGAADWVAVQGQAGQLTQVSQAVELEEN